MEKERMKLDADTEYYWGEVLRALTLEELGAANFNFMKPEREQEVEPTPPEAYQIGGTHYVDMRVQPWDVIDSVFDHTQAKGFYRGNALKYIMRAGCKGPAKEDYQKALHYLEKLIEIL